MPEARRAGWLLYGVVAAGVLGIVLLAFFTGSSRAFSLGVVPAAPAAPFAPGQTACQAPVRVPETGAFDRITVFLEPREVTPSRLVVSVVEAPRARPPSAGRRLRAARVSAGAGKAHTVGVGRVAGGGRPIAVCVTNRGRAAVNLMGNSGLASRTSAASVDGVPTSTDVALEFGRERRSHAVAARDVLRRASLFRAGWLGPWTYVLVLLSVVLVVPVLLARSLGRTTENRRPAT